MASTTDLIQKNAAGVEKVEGLYNSLASKQDAQSEVVNSVSARVDKIEKDLAPAPKG